MTINGVGARWIKVLRIRKRMVKLIKEHNKSQIKDNFFVEYFTPKKNKQLFYSVKLGFWRLYHGSATISRTKSHACWTKHTRKKSNDHLLSTKSKSSSSFTAKNSLLDIEISITAPQKVLITYVQRALLHQQQCHYSCYQIVTWSAKPHHQTTPLQKPPVRGRCCSYMPL